MAKKGRERRENEQAVLDQIGGREPAPKLASRLSWMGLVGGVLWTAVACAAVFVAWLIVADGA